MNKGETVIHVLDRAMPMLQNMAIRCCVDVEDLRQAGAVAVLAFFERAMSARNPLAYFQTVIRSAAADYIHTCQYEDSLDAPFSEEDETTRGDLLAAPSDVPQDYSEVDRRCAALHAALKRLPLEEQMYIREVYGLNAFNPVPADWSVKPRYDRSRHCMSQTAYRRLRADQELAAAIIEVQ